LTKLHLPRLHGQDVRQMEIFPSHVFLLKTKHPKYTCIWRDLWQNRESWRRNDRAEKNSKATKSSPCTEIRQNSTCESWGYPIYCRNFPSPCTNLSWKRSSRATTRYFRISHFE
jgi:hypothetical protein